MLVWKATSSIKIGIHWAISQPLAGGNCFWQMVKCNYSTYQHHHHHWESCKINFHLFSKRMNKSGNSKSIEVQWSKWDVDWKCKNTVWAYRSIFFWINFNGTIEWYAWMKRLHFTIKKESMGWYQIVLISAYFIDFDCFWMNASWRILLEMSLYHRHIDSSIYIDIYTRNQAHTRNEWIIIIFSDLWFVSIEKAYTIGCLRCAAEIKCGNQFQSNVQYTMFWRWRFIHVVCSII